MPILILSVCILVLVLLITWVKLHVFISFLVVSLLAGLLLGLSPHQLLQSIQKGIGDMLGSLLVIICLGAMLGKLVAETGAAQRISDVMMKTFGKKYFQWAMMATGFIVGIPLFYNVGFVLLVPLIFSVAYQTKMPAVYAGIPMLASLSVTHGFLPPHPSPSALVAQFHASYGVTLLYGLIIAIPAAIIAGPLFARTLKKIPSTPLQTFQPRKISNEQLPGAFNSFISSLLPVILLIVATILSFTWKTNDHIHSIILFIGDPLIVMLTSLIIATFTLGFANHISMKTITNFFIDAVKDISAILLIVAGAGAFKEVLAESGVSDNIGWSMSQLSINPLVLAWLIAAIIRVCIGSATVAGLTAAGIVLPLISKSGVNANLVVLSIGAGSLMFSHVNDSGFWMFKEYFNLSIKDTIRSWSLMETIVSVVGLIGVLVLNIFV